MRDILPTIIVDSLRDRYVGGVANAEAQVQAGVVDEDALATALGQAISIAQPLFFRLQKETS